MSNKNFVNVEKEILEMRQRYSKFLEERVRKRKRQEDIHFTRRDRGVLIESVIIGGLIESGLREMISSIL